MNADQTNEKDIIRRNIKRELPCKITDEEFTRIAKQRATKEAEKEELEADLAKEKRRRMDQIELVQDELKVSGRELRTGYQDRTVNCNEVFYRTEEGTGWIHTIRLDTFDEVERRPATAHETQRYLPIMGSSGDEPVEDDNKPKRRKKKTGDGLVEQLHELLEVPLEAVSDDVPLKMANNS
jgi:hypothetical protein